MCAVRTCVCLQLTLLSSDTLQAQQTVFCIISLTNSFALSLHESDAKFLCILISFYVQPRLEIIVSVSLVPVVVAFGGFFFFGDLL